MPIGIWGSDAKTPKSTKTMIGEETNELINSCFFFWLPHVDEGNSVVDFFNVQVC